MKRTHFRFRPRVEPLDRRDAPAVFGNPWPNPGLTLSFVPDGTDVNGAPSRLFQTFAGTPQDVWQREILRAFQSWVAAANVDVGLVTDGGQPVGVAGPPQRDPRFGDVRVAAVPVSEQVAALGMPFDNSAGTRSGDVWLNTAQKFGVAGGDGFDLYSVVLHEAGHAFGVAGSNDVDSVMYQDGVKTRTGLAPADVAAVVALYGPRQPDAYEGTAGNETTATATEARYDSNGFLRKSASLTAATDTDVYWFKADNLQGGGLTVAVRTAGLSLLVPKLEVLDGAGHVIASGTGSAPGSGDVGVHLANGSLNGGAQYFVRVTAGGDPTFAAGSYRLEITTDAAEPPKGGGLDDPEVGENDEPTTAVDLRKQIASGDTRFDYRVDASLSTAADVDFYRVRAGQAGGVMTATVWSTGAGATDPVVGVYDELGNPIAVTAVVHDGGAYTVQLANAGSGQDYYVGVRHGLASAADAGNYSLGVDFGGSPVTLNPVGSGTLTAAAPTAAFDYAVDPAGVHHFLLSVAPAAGGSVTIEIVDAAGHTLDSRTAAAGDVASLNVYLNPGAYTVRVTGSGPGDLHFAVKATSISDPVGPQAIDVDKNPVGPPPPPTSPPPPVAPPPVSPPPTTVPPSPPPAVTPVPPTGSNTVPVPPSDRPGATRPAPARTFTAAADVPGGTVRSFNPNAGERLALTPFPGLPVSARVAEADFTGDGVADLVVGTGPGAAALVRVLNGADLSELFAVRPFEASFTGGVYVAAGDVNGDGVADLVVTPDEGGGPRVRVFNGSGFGLVADFLGIDDPNFRGGARAAVGDLDGDGFGDLVVAAGFGGGPRVAAFSGTTLATGPVKLFADFLAFEPELRNGAFVAAGDVTGDGTADLIAGGGPGGAPRVTVFDGAALLRNTQARTADFFAGDVADRGGVRLTAKDLDGDAKADVVAGSAGRVAAYAGSSLAAGSASELFALDAFPGVSAGVFVG